MKAEAQICDGLTSIKLPKPKPSYKKCPREVHKSTISGIFGTFVMLYAVAHQLHSQNGVYKCFRNLAGRMNVLQPVGCYCPGTEVDVQIGKKYNEAKGRHKLNGKLARHAAWFPFWFTAKRFTTHISALFRARPVPIAWLSSLLKRYHYIEMF